MLLLYYYCYCSNQSIGQVTSGGKVMAFVSHQSIVMVVQIPVQNKKQKTKCVRACQELLKKINGSRTSDRGKTLEDLQLH